VDLSAYLFGDILAVTRTDLAFIWCGAGLVLALLTWRWQALLTATLNADLAHAAGINPDRERLVLTLALAVVVAVALKVVGALLIAAMLIIPAAAARGITRTPEAMALAASLIGIGAVLAGLWGSLTWDTPAGPSIIVATTVVFVGSAAAMRRV
jgi:zinc transport system permease protein